MSLMEGVQHLKISLEEIRLATNNFGEENYIARGGFGKVYIGKLTLSGQQITVALKRLDRSLGQGNREFLMEIQMLSCYRHKNLVCLVGFCDEGGENILVYEHAKHGSLDRYLSDTTKLSWLQRLQISVGAARGFNYLHHDVGPQHRVLHRDIKSSNILLNENWEARVSDFGLSKIGPSNVEYTFLVTSACGTMGYIDPQYVKTGILTKESDVYSFGVLLFELLCGRLALTNKYQDERRFLASLAQRCYKENRVHDIIPADLINQMKVDSFMFSMVANQCLLENRIERPTMGWILEKLEKALELQTSSKLIGFIRVGTWGKRSGDPQHQWSFELEKYHTLVKIAIDHGDAIYSLIFTIESRGVLHTSDKIGGSPDGKKVSEITFDADEKIIGINGTIGTRDGHTIISSLSFNTNKRTHGPFGQPTETGFSVPLEQAGLLVGFYGIATNYINSIGVYMKTNEEIIKVGTWGSVRSFGPPNVWSLELEKNHHLKKIEIGHGDLIYSLMFTTQYRGVKATSKKAGGWNGAEMVAEVNFDWDEEINAINGTIASSRQAYAGYTVISSISFATNKRTHGPFGQVRGTPFTVPWDNGSFAGFYGFCGYFIDCIGVYLRATT